MTAKTTSTPAIRPMTSELGTLTNAHGAVIATSPASVPVGPPPTVCATAGVTAAIPTTSTPAATARPKPNGLIPKIKRIY